MKPQTAQLLVIDELERATSRFGPMQSAHEGYAVLKEELDELWAEVKSGNVNGYNGHRAVSEAVQVGAMALRFLIDCCDDESAVQHTHKANGTGRFAPPPNFGYSG